MRVALASVPVVNLVAAARVAVVWAAVARAAVTLGVSGPAVPIKLGVLTVSDRAHAQVYQVTQPSLFLSCTFWA